MPDVHYHVVPSIQSALHRLGPATVTAVLGSSVAVAVDGVERFATLAVAGLYTPVAGDKVLLIETEAAAYVIGVLHATGPMTIRAPADLHLQAASGSILLDAAQIRVRGTEVRVEAGRLHLVADRLRERFQAVRRVVAGTMDVEAGTLRTRVRETCSFVVKRFQAKADTTVDIDGERINLG